MRSWTSLTSYSKWLLFPVMTLLSWAQANNSLSITAPATGTVVTPGQQLSVTVQGAANSSITIVGLVGQEPFPSSGPQQGVGPYQFNLTLPDGIAPGRYALTAVGGTGLGQGIGAVSNPIYLQVEPSLAIATLRVSPTPLFLNFAGQTARLQIYGITSSNGLISLENSSRLTITSQNPSIAVFSNGEVQTKAAGATTLTFQYQTPDSQAPITAQAQVTVQTSSPGDLNGDGQVDNNDLRILTRFLNTPASSNADARDLNHDGQINAEDARILVTLCTHSRCASY